MKISNQHRFLGRETEGLLAAEQTAAWRNMSAAFGGKQEMVVCSSLNHSTAQELCG